MPKWEGCLKLHAGCGGMVRWVEAYDQPGVGWTGQCLHCDTEGLVLEQIIPVESGEAKRKVLESPINGYEQDKLADLKWDEDQSWQENQERITEKVESVL